MINLDGIKSRTKTIINLTLPIIQGVAVSAYFGMVNARELFEEISSDLYPDSDKLMDSQIAHTMLSSPVAWCLLAILVISIAKEFYFKNKNYRISANVAIALAIGSILGVVSYIIYAPIRT